MTDLRHHLAGPDYNRYLCRCMSDRDIERIFRQNYKPLCMYALHFLEDIAAAEDAVQDVFVRLWEACPPEGIGKPYLYAMTRNRCIDILRRSARTVSMPEDVSIASPDEQIVERSETEARLWEAVGRLPGRRRQLLLMSKRDGLKYEEIAARTGLSVSTVRNQISRALKTLRSEGADILPVIIFFV